MTAGSPNDTRKRFPVRRCECGHEEGDHKSGDQSGLHKPRPGVCFVCDCREYREVPDPPKPDREAA